MSRWIAITLAITVLIGLVGFGLGFQRADDSLNFYRDDPGSSTLTIVATTGSAEIWVRPYIVEQDEQSVVIGMWVWQDRIRPHTAIGVERTYALELDQPLGDREVRTADGARTDLSAHGPFDVIVLSGSVAELPDALLALLKPGGRLMAIVGDEPVMRATLVQRTEAGLASSQPWDTIAPRLLNFPEPSRFRF